MKTVDNRMFHTRKVLDTEVKTTRVNIFLTKEEYINLYNTFKASGLKSNGYLKKLIFQANNELKNDISSIIRLRTLKALTYLLKTGEYEPKEIQSIIEALKIDSTKA